MSGKHIPIMYLTYTLTYTSCSILDDWDNIVERPVSLRNIKTLKGVEVYVGIKKNKFFGFLLTYLYLCRPIHNIHIYNKV